MESGGRGQAGHGGQVAARLGVAGAHQHAAGHGAYREDMAGLDQVGRLGVARHRHLDGAGAVGGRNAGLDAFGGLDRLGEIGAVSRAAALRVRDAAITLVGPHDATLFLGGNEPRVFQPGVLEIPA